MSNNKQSIKLYTEEDVLNMLRSFHNMEMNVQLCMLKLTPIELPSDEEIEKIAFRRINGLTDYLTPKELNCLREGYMNGMKLLINKIQGGNK